MFAHTSGHVFTRRRVSSDELMNPLLGASVEGDALQRLAERVCALAGVDRAYLIRVHDDVLDCEFEYCINADVPPFQPTFRNVRNSVPTLVGRTLRGECVVVDNVDALGDLPDIPELRKQLIKALCAANPLFSLELISHLIFLFLQAFCQSKAAWWGSIRCTAANGPLTNYGCWRYSAT